MSYSDVKSDHHDHYEEMYSKTLFGFWIYILTDFMLFGTLFAVYAVLSQNLFGGPSPKQLFALPTMLTQTLVMLASSFSVGLASISVHKRRPGSTIAWLFITLLLGIGFMWIEMADFARLIADGNGWQRNGFLSAYFTLVGTHGIHMVFALLWTVLFILPVIYHGVTPRGMRRIACLKMFWQFLNIVWIFIFTIVYLLGVS